MQLKSSYLNLCLSLCCFYCIWLKQSSYLGAFDLLLTVEGNAGPEIDRVVRRDLINLRTFHMEYDMCSVSCYTIKLCFCLMCYMPCCLVYWNKISIETRP
jgi:hypothetical protein